MILKYILTIYVVSTPVLSAVIGNSTAAELEVLADLSRDIDYCRIPPEPANGRYEIEGDTMPDLLGPLFMQSIPITVHCNEGYAANGNSELTLTCVDSVVQNIGSIPQCMRYCLLKPHRSVKYKCITPENGDMRDCYSLEFVGTTIVPTCKEHFQGSPEDMHCTEQGLDHVAKCSQILTKGTNITILTRDKTEVYVNSLEYVKKVRPSVMPDESTTRLVDQDTVVNNNMNNDRKVTKTVVNIENKKVQITIGDIVIHIN